MNMDQALDISIRTLHQLEEEFRDLKREGIIDIMIAGAGGQATPPDVTPDIGFHLTVDGEDFKKHAEEIRVRAVAIADPRVRLAFFPKPSS